MKKLILLVFILGLSFLASAQEPKGNLGKPLAVIRHMFPELKCLGKEADDRGDLWICFDSDQYHEYTYYFVIKDGRVISESTMIDTTDNLPNVNYIYYIIMTDKFYNHGGWEHSDVAYSILKAAEILRNENKLMIVNECEAALYYSDYIVDLQYNKDEDYTFVTHAYYTQ